MASAIVVVTLFYLAQPAGFWFQVFLGVVFLFLFTGLLFAARFFYSSERETMLEVLAAARRAAAKPFSRSER